MFPPYEFSSKPGDTKQNTGAAAFDTGNGRFDSPAAALRPCAAGFPAPPGTFDPGDGRFPSRAKVILAHDLKEYSGG
jgi:hypothetical protein